MFQFSIESEKDMSEWDNYVFSHPLATPFHLSSWLNTIYHTYKFYPLLFVNRDSEKNISGIFPSFYINSVLNGKRIVSIPFSDYGGPLCTDNSKMAEYANFLIDNYRNRVKYFEFRCSFSLNNKSTYNNFYKKHILELSKDPSEIKSKLNKRTIQYSIRKASDAGVVIKEDNTVNGLLEFFRLNYLTRKKHGVPTQPKKYFNTLFQNVIKNNLGQIYLAYINNKIIAASLFLIFRDTIHYKYNASDPKNLKEFKPNHLLTWKAIEKACIDGYKYFDFGRTAISNKGLMRYKKMWGAIPRDCEYSYYPEAMGVNSIDENKFIYKILTNSWRLLPNFIDQKISNVLYKHMA